MRPAFDRLGSPFCMVWSCWEPAVQPAFAQGIARYHNFLETNSELFPDSKTLLDLLLVWPYENWFRRAGGECPGRMASAAGRTGCGTAVAVNARRRNLERLARVHCDPSQGTREAGVCGAEAAGMDNCLAAPPSQEQTDSLTTGMFYRNVRFWTVGDASVRHPYSRIVRLWHLWSSRRPGRL